MDEIMQMVSTVGFPIVAVIGMGFFFYKMWTTQEQRNKEREEMLMNLIRELSVNLADLGRIIDENSKNIAVLSEKVESVEHKLEGK